MVYFYKILLTYTCPEICDLFNNNDFIMFVETWGHRHIYFYVPHFQHFELNGTICKPSSKRASGVIIIYISETLIKPDSIVCC